MSSYVSAIKVMKPSDKNSVLLNARPPAPGSNALYRTLLLCLGPHKRQAMIVQPSNVRCDLLVTEERERQLWAFSALQQQLKLSFRQILALKDQ